MSRIIHFFKNEDGVTAIEYGLIAAATGLALAASMPAIETGLGTVFGSVSGQLK
jgi:pilus assembly protein Flp/PilA